MKLNGVEGEVKSSTASQIKFIVPYNTALTKHKIVIEGGGKQFESAVEFTVTKTGKNAKWNAVTVNIPNSQNVSIFPGGFSFVFDGKLFWGFTAIGGTPVSQYYFMYNPARPDSGWQAEAIDGKLPVTLQDAVPAVLGNKVYFGNSLHADNYGKWWQFDPMAKTFTPVAPIPGTHAALGIAFTVGAQMFAASEDDNKALYAFNPANNGSWTKAVDAFYSQINLGGAVVLGNDVIIGPSFKAGQPPVRKFMHKFTPNGTGGTVTELPEIPDAKMGILTKTPAFAFKGKGYFMVNERMWEYNPAATIPWRLVMTDNLNLSMEHVGVVGDVVYGWNNKGKIFLLEFID